MKILLYPGQPGEGMGYNPVKPLPVAITVHADRRCERVPDCPDSWVNEDRATWPTLVGFQLDADVQHVEVLADDWREDPAAAVGMFPVFVENGSMFNLAVPVTRVHVAVADEARS